MIGWISRYPRQVGRVLLLLGVILAGFLANHGYLPQPEGQWKEHAVIAVERNSTPHYGRIERLYRLKLSDEAETLVVDPDLVTLFNQQLLLSQPRPTKIEALSDGTVDDSSIRPVGLRLMDGRLLLDPLQVHRLRRPFELLGVAVCSIIVLVGVMLQIWGRSTRAVAPPVVRAQV